MLSALPAFYFFCCRGKVNTLSTSPRVSPSLWLGYHPRLSIVRLRWRRGLLCVAVGAEVGEQEIVYTVSTFILVRVPPSTLSVRRLQRRSPLCPLLHGFPLASPRVPPRFSTGSPSLLHGFPLALARVSPAVKHSAPPPEAWAALCYCGSGKDVVSER